MTVISRTIPARVPVLDAKVLSRSPYWRPRRRRDRSLLRLHRFGIERREPATRTTTSSRAAGSARRLMQAGWASAALGFVSHFFIVCLFALAYVIVTKRMAGLNARPILWGAIYGAIIYGVMNYVVVPLSATNFQRADGLVSRARTDRARVRSRRAHRAVRATSVIATRAAQR